MINILNIKKTAFILMITAMLQPHSLVNTAFAQADAAESPPAEQASEPENTDNKSSDKAEDDADKQSADAPAEDWEHPRFVPDE